MCIRDSALAVLSSLHGHSLFSVGLRMKYFSEPKQIMQIKSTETALAVFNWETAFIPYPYYTKPFNYGYFIFAVSRVTTVIVKNNPFCKFLLGISFAQLVDCLLYTSLGFFVFGLFSLDFVKS